MENDTPKALGALQVDETKLMGQVHEVVRSSVEETLNALLDVEADEICGAQRYERSPDRVDTRAGHYERTLETKAGAMTLKVPSLPQTKSYTYRKGILRDCQKFCVLSRFIND